MTFARWSHMRDLACVGEDTVGSWEKAKGIYLDEADMYLKKPRSEWPCGILLRAGTHSVDHPGCDTTNWLE